MMSFATSCSQTKAGTRVAQRLSAKPKRQAHFCRIMDMRCPSVAKNHKSTSKPATIHPRYSEDPTLNDCDKWLCGVWARGLSPDAIHMESDLTSAPPRHPERRLIMKGRIDEPIFLDYAGPRLQHCDGGRGRGNSPKLGHCCVAGITLRTATDRTLWWNCTRRAGLAERSCERCVPV